jgi:cytochrome c553
MKFNSKMKSILMLSTLFCLLGFSGVSQAVRLSGTCPTSHTMDMSSCHGTDGNGINASDDVPYLAGQEFMYMCAWLDACRKQGKKCEGHEDIATQFSDHNIVDLAMFYAHLPSIKW